MKTPRKMLCMTISLMMIMSCLLYISKIDVSAANYNLTSYLTSPSSLEFYGYSSKSGNNYYYSNTSVQSSSYVICRNGAITDGTLYDVIIYPFKCGQNGIIAYYGGIFTQGSYAGYKLVVTTHVSSGLGTPINWTGFMAFNDLDANESPFSDLCA